MNILYLCDEYPPGKHGGIGTSVKLLAREMVKQGHRVIVAGLYPLGYGGDDAFDDEGVKVYRYRLGWDSPWFENDELLIVRITSRILKATGLLQRDIKKSLETYRAKLEELITENQIDIVEMPDFNDYVKGCRGYVPFPKLSVPVVVKMNGSLTYFGEEEGKPVADNVFEMEHHIIHQADGVVAVSQYTAKKSAAYFDYQKPIEVLYNGINTDLHISETVKKPMQVIFTGSLVAKKGIYRLAKAWNMVANSKPDARLLVLGKGDTENVLDFLTPQARATVTFLGHVDSATLYRHLAESAVAVFPSYAEAFALAPMEAMVCGTAIINSNRTSGAELIENDVDGLLIDPDDIIQLASAIVYLLTDTGSCARLAKNGYKKVKAAFGIAGIAKQNLAFYAKVIPAKAKA